MIKEVNRKGMKTKVLDLLRSTEFGKKYFDYPKFNEMQSIKESSIETKLHLFHFQVKVYLNMESNNYQNKRRLKYRE